MSLAEITPTKLARKPRSPKPKSKKATTVPPSDGMSAQKETLLPLKVTHDTMPEPALASFFSAFEDSVFQQAKRSDVRMVEPVRVDETKAGTVSPEGVGGHLFEAAVHLIEAGRLLAIMVWAAGKRRVS
jgi:hypothetical protein